MHAKPNSTLRPMRIFVSMLIRTAILVLSMVGVSRADLFGVRWDRWDPIAVHPDGQRIAYTAPASDEESLVKGIWAAENILPPLVEAN